MTQSMRPAQSQSVQELEKKKDDEEEGDKKTQYRTGAKQKQRRSKHIKGSKNAYLLGHNTKSAN